MHELITADSIVVTTQRGPCKVELLFGDITKLPLDQKVNIILISAFPGDYAANNASVIGALKRNLDLSVWKFSTDKELDLRKHYSCWMSKVLPENVPYRRLVCFERDMKKIGTHPAVLVGDVFRALMPIFNNQDSTVITPLLATGCQNFSKPVMLKAMVDAACNWMKAGLPVRCMKMVLYTSHPDSLTDEEKELVTVFEHLKRRWEKKRIRKTFSMVYDIYISYSSKDKHLVDKIVTDLQSYAKDLNVFAEKQEINVHMAWQEAMFETMSSCKRIMAVITPSYLESNECLEQFNIAMCCSRLRGYEMLAPLYVETVPNMPSYITLVQYIDCRKQAADQSIVARISQGCKQVIDWLSAVKDEIGRLSSICDYSYDVFISYSHKDAKEAEILWSLFQRSGSNMRVFFDTSELKTGKSWQQMLYRCLDSTKCVICLISDPYLTSAICQEEINIAISRVLMQVDNGVKFIPICISELTTVPHWLRSLNMLDGRGDLCYDVLRAASTATLLWLELGIATETVFSKPKCSNVTSLCENTRKRDVVNNFSFNKNIVEKNTFSVKDNDKLMIISKSETSELTCDVAFCYCHDDMRYASIFGSMLTSAIPGIRISYGSEPPQERIHNVDNARMVIVFMSAPFLEADQLKDELHIAMCRHRKKQVLYPILTNTMPMNPTYVSLLQYGVSFTDNFWKEKCDNWGKSSIKYTVIGGEIPGSYKCLLYQQLALEKALLDVVQSLVEERMSITGFNSNLLNPLEIHDTENGNMEEITCEDCLVQLSANELAVLSGQAPDVETILDSFDDDDGVESVDSNGHPMSHGSQTSQDVPNNDRSQTSPDTPNNDRSQTGQDTPNNDRSQTSHDAPNKDKPQDSFDIQENDNDCAKFTEVKGNGSESDINGVPESSIVSCDNNGAGDHDGTDITAIDPLMNDGNEPVVISDPKTFSKHLSEPGIVSVKKPVVTFADRSHSDIHLKSSDSRHVSQTKTQYCIIL